MPTRSPCLSKPTTYICEESFKHKTQNLPATILVERLGNRTWLLESVSKETENTTEYRASTVADALCTLMPTTFSAELSSASGCATMTYFQIVWRPSLLTLFPEFTEIYNTENKRTSY